MKFSVNSQVLAQELRLLDKIIAVKSPYPVLQNVLFIADEKLAMATTDLEVSLETSCDALIEEKGAITLPSKKLLSIIEQLPDCTVQIIEEKNHAYLNAGLFRSRIQTLKASDYPSIPQINGELSSVAFSDLQTMIARTRYAIAEKGTKFQIDGAQLVVDAENNAAAMVTTNGKSLSFTAAPWRSAKNVSFIIPSKTLDVLSASEAQGDIDVAEGENHLFFTLGHRVLASRMLDAKFPSYQRVIPKNNEHLALIDRAAFAAVLRRVGLMSEDTLAITMHTSKDSMAITTQSVDMGDAAEAFDIGYTGPDLKLKTNWKMLLNFLEAATSERIRMFLKDNDTAILLKDDTDNFLNVVIVLRS